VSIFSALTALGSLGKAIDRAIQFFEKIWDKRQLEKAKSEVREETVRNINIKTYEQLDAADAVAADLKGKTPEEVRDAVEKSRQP
jgi:hypothetical protein